VKKTITTVIGLGAFVLGGLLAQQSAVESIELFEDRVNKLKNKRPPETPTE